MDGRIELLAEHQQSKNMYMCTNKLQTTLTNYKLQTTNLPPDVLNAVRTLYNGAETSVKVNGTLSPPFPNTSGVKQGCPLSGILYILTQEVQLHMIRTDPAIRGIPIPRDPTAPFPPLPCACPRAATRSQSVASSTTRW